MLKSYAGDLSVSIYCEYNVAFDFAERQPSSVDAPPSYSEATRAEPVASGQTASNLETHASSSLLAPQVRDSSFRVIRGRQVILVNVLQGSLPPPPSYDSATTTDNHTQSRQEPR